MFRLHLCALFIAFQLLLSATTNHAAGKNEGEASSDETSNEKGEEPFQIRVTVPNMQTITINGLYSTTTIWELKQKINAKILSLKEAESLKQAEVEALVEEIANSITIKPDKSADKTGPSSSGTNADEK